MRRALLLVLFCISLIRVTAQPLSGTTGLLNIPSAMMQEDGTFMAGGNFLPEAMTPEIWDYATGNYFLNITFLPFLEINYRMILFKDKDSERFNAQDRSFSARLRLLKEGDIRPAVVFGGNDIYTHVASGNQYFGTLYSVATKNLKLAEQNLGITIGYAIDPTEHNKNQGVFGGLNYSPFPTIPLNLMAEYDSNAINAGASLLLFKHLYIYGLAYDLNYFAGGFRFLVYLKN